MADKRYGSYVTINGVSRYYPPERTTRVRPHLRAAPGGNFVNVSGHVRQTRSRQRYHAEMITTYEGMAIVHITDRKTNGFRSLFVGRPEMGRDVVEAINSGRVAPREGFLH